MAYNPSNLGYIGIGKQALKTTAVAPQKYFAYTSDESGTTFEAETLREAGDGQFDKTSVKTIYSPAVSFSGYARPETAANLYAALLGSDTPSSLTTTPFYHTIIPKVQTVTTPVQPWLTMHRTLVSSTNSKVERFRGVKLSAITLEAEAGQPVTMSVEGTALTAHLTTSAMTATYETGNPFSFYHGVYHVNAPSTSNFDIKSFSIALRAVNDEEIQTVAITRHDIINHRFEAEVTLGINYTDYALYQKANFGNTTTPTEDFSDGSATVILKTNAGTTSEERLQIGIPKVRLQPINIPMNAEVATLEQTMAGMGFKQATTALVTVTAYNQIATTLPL
jgi:hypothetical protein